MALGISRGCPCEHHHPCPHHHRNRCLHLPLKDGTLIGRSRIFHLGGVKARVKVTIRVRVRVRIRPRARVRLRLRVRVLGF